MAYVHHLEVIEKRCATAQVVTAIAASAGAKDLTIPDADAAIAEFDAWLISEPTPLDNEKRELLKALGVA